MIRRALHLTIVLALTAVLAACSGGGGGGESLAGVPTNPGTPVDPNVPMDDGGMGGTGGVGSGGLTGAVQDFGSIFVNDVEMQTDTATIRVEGEEVSEDALQAGQQVLVIGDLTSREAETVDYRANVKGALDAITMVDAELGEATLSVLGQTVRTSAATRYVNGSLLSLAVGQLLEISGFVDVDGTIVATYIEVLSTLDTFKVLGSVSNSDTQGFVINGLTVDTSQAILEGFGDTELADGLRVEVRAPATAFANGEVLAETVELLEPDEFIEGATLDIEGFIDRFTSSADFEVTQIPVATNANTVFLNGDSTGIALNVRVQVEGSVDANQIVQAERVIIQSSDAVRAEGIVESVDVATATVTVLGVTFTVRPQTEFDDDSAAGVTPFTLSDINAGDYLEIRAYIDSAAVVASSIEREDIDESARLRGPVTAEDAINGELSILEVPVTGVEGITEYQDLNENPITQGQFHDLLEIGDFVKARWRNFSSTSETVDDLELESED